MVESLSAAFIASPLRSHDLTIRLEELEERDSAKRLPFLYVANDILQRQENTDNPFELEFLPVSQPLTLWLLPSYSSYCYLFG